MYIKTEKNIFITIFLLAVALMVMFLVYAQQRPTKTCPEYKSQRAAQRDIKNNPGLDGDGDGRACNSYPYKT